MPLERQPSDANAIATPVTTARVETPQQREATLIMGRTDRPSIPQIIMDAEIGRGGMGVVWRGRQDWIDRPVAVKVLHHQASSDPQFRQRFQREARTLASFNHPHLVACYQAGINDQGQCYLVMELVEGPDLNNWLLTNGPLPAAAVIDLGIAIAQALDHALQTGVIHRDVKCENILCAAMSSSAVGHLPFLPKLADLGLARPLQASDGNPSMTATGVAVGTPNTMAPEQFDDPASVDHGADIYALGCVLFQAVSGRRAFAQRALSHIVIAKNDAAALDHLVTAIAHRGLRALIRRCLEADPSRRPADYTAIISQLRSLRDEPASTGDGQPRSPSPWRRRALMAALFLPIAGAWWLLRPPETENTGTEQVAESTLQMVADDSRAATTRVAAGSWPAGPLWSDDFLGRLAAWDNPDSAWAASEDPGSAAYPAPIDGSSGSTPGRLQRSFPPSSAQSLQWVLSPLPDLSGALFDDLQLSLSSGQWELRFTLQALGEFAILTPTVSGPEGDITTYAPLTLNGDGGIAEPYTIHLSWQGTQISASSADHQIDFSLPEVIPWEHLRLSVSGGAVRLHHLAVREDPDS